MPFIKSLSSVSHVVLVSQIMSDRPANGDNLLDYIVITLETMRDQMATMQEQVATKDDLARLEARLSDKLEVEITAVRGDIERVHLRLDSIERALSSRLSLIETEMSRLRSVVYLLAKDQPEMLRLLGQTSSPADNN